MDRIKAGVPAGASLIVLSSGFYASYGIWTTLIGNAIGGYAASAIRSLLVLAILLPIAAICKSFEPVDLRRNWRHLLGLLMSACFVWGPLYYAILNAGVGISLAINYAGIVLGMFIFGRLLAGERMTKDKAVAGAVGIIGLALVFLPNGSQLVLLAMSAALLSGFGIAAHSVFAKQISYGATQSTVCMWLASAVANIVMSAVLENPPNLALGENGSI